MLSEMAIALEGVQTFPDFARAGLGHLPGFISGWLYWYFWVVVVARYFLDWLRAIFKGKSPRGNDLPAGLRDQPFGRVIGDGKT